MTYSPFIISTLPSNQKAFLMSDGTLAVVQISASTKERSAWNTVPDQHVSVQVSVWQANNDGSPVLVNGNKVGPPMKSHTILTSAIAEGRVQLSDTLTQATLGALSRLSNWLAVQPHIQALLASQPVG